MKGTSACAPECSIPSGAGIDLIVRPGPAGSNWTFPDGYTVLPAVSPANGMGVAVNGVATDVLTVLYQDRRLDFSGVIPTVPASGASMNFPNGFPLDDEVIGISDGDLIRLGNGAMQEVTNVAGNTVHFRDDAASRLNQRNALQGSVMALKGDEPNFPDLPVSRVVMVTYYLRLGPDGAPQLIRRLNYGPERVVAAGIENLQLSWDLVDGLAIPPASRTSPPKRRDRFARPTSTWPADRAESVHWPAGAIGAHHAGQPAQHGIRQQVRHHTMTATFIIRNQRGVALVAVLLILFMTSAILAGFLFTASTDVQLRAVDRSRTRALYAAHGAIEKLTADLGDLFATDFAPNRDDLQDLEAAAPVMEGMAFTADDGLGYNIVPANGFNGAGAPIAASGVVESGPYEGFVGLITPYWLWVTSHGSDGAEARLRRRLQTVSIPCSSSACYSETDLSFFAGPDFNFGGRVHTNGNLFLASGSTLQLTDKVTAFREVIRTHLSNGWLTTNGYNGRVRPITTPGSFRDLEREEGSLQGTLGSDPNEPTWTDRSVSTYHGNIRNGRTGAKQLTAAAHHRGQPADRVDPAAGARRERVHHRAANVFGSGRANPAVEHRRGDHRASRQLECGGAGQPGHTRRPCRPEAMAAPFSPRRRQA